MIKATASVDLRTLFHINFVLLFCGFFVQLVGFVLDCRESCLALEVTISLHCGQSMAAQVVAEKCGGK
jgi:hypothetical protein